MTDSASHTFLQNRRVVFLIVSYSIVNIGKLRYKHLYHKFI